MIVAKRLNILLKGDKMEYILTGMTKKQFKKQTGLEFSKETLKDQKLLNWWGLPYKKFWGFIKKTRLKDEVIVHDPKKLIGYIKNRGKIIEAIKVKNYTVKINKSGVHHTIFVKKNMIDKLKKEGWESGEPVKIELTRMPGENDEAKK